MADHTQEAESAAQGITDAEIAGIMGWRGPGVYSGPTLRKIRRVLEEDRNRRAVPADTGVDGLPPLHPQRKVLTVAIDALEAMLQQFTRTPSTLADSATRGQAHAALADLRAELASRGAAQGRTTSEESGNGR